MKNNSLTYFSFLLFVLGLFLIYYSSTKIQPIVVKISDINKEMMGKTVVIEGNITFIRRKESGIYMTIEDDTGKIFVPLFSNLVSSIDKEIINELSLGKHVRIKGYVDMYKDSYEVIPYCSSCIEIINR